MSRILIVTTMRNEGPFLLEWIAHHKSIGVTDFLIFTNDCDDGTDLLLDALDEAGELHHIRQTRGEKSVQWQALKAAWDHSVRRDVDWAMCIDCDEFVNLRAPFETLNDMIAAADQADAIVLPWRFFGHSHHLSFADAPITQRFTQSVPEHVAFPLVTRFFKTLLRVRRGPFAKFGVHRPKTKKHEETSPGWLNGSGKAMPDAFAQNDQQLIVPDPLCGRDWVQLNHYSLRSIEDFLVKRQRGLPNRADKQIDALYWAERNFNNVEDTTILRHAKSMAAGLARLKALSGIASGHSKCVDLHRSKIGALLEKPSEVTLFTRLALLSSSQPPIGADATHLLQMTARAWSGRAS